MKIQFKLSIYVAMLFGLAAVAQAVPLRMNFGSVGYAVTGISGEDVGP